MEHFGRTYQKYALDRGIYFTPIDEVSQDDIPPALKWESNIHQVEVARLEAQHAVLRQVFDNRLIFPPVDTIRTILDCGCGAGDWAVDVANQYPEAEVLST